MQSGIGMGGDEWCVCQFMSPGVVILGLETAESVPVPPSLYCLLKACLISFSECPCTMMHIYFRVQTCLFDRKPGGSNMKPY